MKKTLKQGLMSMTGFASQAGSHGDWTWGVEIRAVNGRGLDLRLRMPDWIEGLEAEARKLFQGRLARGNVTVSLKVQRPTEVNALALNEATLDATLDALSKIEAAALAKGLDFAQTSAADVAAMRGVLDVAEPDVVDDIPALRAAVMKTLDEGLTAFEADRAREGAALGQILGDQIARVETLTHAAASAIGDREVAARAGIDRALARLLEATEVPDEARMVQELALIAVKNDVTEELDRLTAHIAAARDLMAEPGAKGRKFDFLMQEFNREANTLCSKSQSTALTAVGLDLKAVIDQMREQVQNVE